ncbi:hypothetical protein Tco_0477663 [Tanacetum coccineum]
MVIVPIHQDTFLVPPMATPVIDLTVSHPVSTTVHALLPTSTATTTSITTTTSLPPPPPQPQQISSDMILLQRIGELEQHIADLIQSNLALEERKYSNNGCLKINPTWLMKITRIYFEALEKSLERDYSNQLLSDLEEARRKKRKKCSSPRTPSGSPPSQPPPPPPPAGASGALCTSGASGSSQFPPPTPPPSTGTSGSAQQQGSKAPSSSKTAASTPQSMAWTISDTRYESTVVSAAHESSPTDSLMNEDSIPEEHATVLVSSYEPHAENSSLAKIGDMTTFMNWYCNKVNNIVLTQADFEGQTYEVVKAFYPDVIHLQFQMEECHKMLTNQIN